MEASCSRRLLAVFKPAASVMPLAFTLALTLVISSGGGIMLTSTTSCVQAGCECDVFSSDSSLNSSFDSSFILGGCIMLTSTASCAHACHECDLYSFDSSFISSPDFSFDSSYLFRWWHHAHVDC